MENRKEKKINKIKEQLERLRAKLQADGIKSQHPKSKPKLKKTQSKSIKPTVKVKPKAETKIKVKPKAETKIKVKPKAETKIKVKPKAEAKRKAKEEKKKKIEAKRKAKEEKKKKIEAKIKAKEEKKKAEAKRKAEEEAKKKAEEEAKRTYEEELEEQLTEEEIAGFQLEKTDMDKMCNKVCEIIADYENNGVLQSQLWKKLKLSSRDGSRLALKLERMGMITREKILEKERWTYRLIIKKIPIGTKSIEGAPCLTCEVASKCSLEGEISPKTCQWIEDWVLIELKNN